MVKSLVIIESPFAAKDRLAVHNNIDYGWACLEDSLKRGEAPFASHLFYPVVLSDRDPKERQLGMDCGWAWMIKADLVAVYTDLGVSPGMKAGIERARSHNIPIEFRSLKSEEPESPK